jgi:hypothetical protein
MRWKERQNGPKWRKWFAWYPVKIGDTWVWLEVIERSVEFMCDHAIVEHRFRGISQ